MYFKITKHLNTAITTITNMSNKITLKIEEDIYFKLMALKAKLKCKTWDELFKKIISKYGK